MVRCSRARPPLTTICGLRISGAAIVRTVGAFIELLLKGMAPLILRGTGERNAAFDSGNEKWSVPEMTRDCMLTARRALFAGGVALLAFAGSAPTTQAQELKAWRHSLIAPKSDAGFFYMAAKRGFFEREGLKIE